MITTSLLRSLIRETLLLEEVYGAQAVVYHGTKADPKKLIAALLKDQFKPGEGDGSLYGEGLYTVYDLGKVPLQTSGKPIKMPTDEDWKNVFGSKTGSGGYGNHIIKLKINLYGYIIFDLDVAATVYGKPLSIVEQAQEVGLDESLVEELRSLRAYETDKYTGPAALQASGFLAGKVKGIVYTGSRDGRCALIYDPTTAVPIAWKSISDKNWTPVDKESIKPVLRRSASGDWEADKYKDPQLKMLKKLEKLPIDQRVVEGNLRIIDRTPVTSLPEGLRVEGDLSLYGAKNITSLPKGLKVKRDLDISHSSIISLPDGLEVGGDFDLYKTRIASLPEGLNVGGTLLLHGTLVTSLPQSLKVGLEVFSFSGDKLKVPKHLKGKLANE
jgi:hypothetical protein